MKRAGILSLLLLLLTACASRPFGEEPVHEAVRENGNMANRIDTSRVGLVGHSLGGYTVLGFSGAWASWKIPQVKAVLVLSPYTKPFVVHGTLGGVSVPVMYQGGTLDVGVTSVVRRPGGAFDTSPAPKYYVEFTGAGHFAWTNLNRRVHSRILHYSVAFMDAYLRGFPDEAIKEKILGVSSLCFER